MDVSDRVDLERILLLVENEVSFGLTWVADESEVTAAFSRRALFVTMPSLVDREELGDHSTERFEVLVVRHAAVEHLVTALTLGVGRRREPVDGVHRWIAKGQYLRWRFAESSRVRAMSCTTLIDASALAFCWLDPGTVLSWSIIALSRERTASLEVSSPALSLL